ncbi:MAG: DUF3080 family protein, partial [Pseudomonadales bacterium]|nr:DUF3080 family protein [Pseudomonadales bacterium]
QLPAVIWNSSFGSVELARYLRVGAGQSDSEFESLLEGGLPDLLSPDYLGLFEQWLEAIARLQSVSQWDMGGISRYVHNSTVPGVIESERLFEVSEIRFTPYIRLFQFWEVLPGLGLYFHRAGYYQARLNQVSALIEARLDRGVICPVPGKMPVRVKGLLFNYYGPTVQPYLTKLDQVYRREVSLFRKLVEQQQIVVPEDWMRYFQYYFDYAPDSDSEPHQASEMHTKSLWFEFRKAVDRHQKAWQQVLDQCRG